MASIKERKGFTLVELIIVIAILVVLAAVIIPVFTNILENANNAADMHNARSFASAISCYYALHPEKLKALIDVCESPRSAHCVILSVGKYDSSINPDLANALKEAGYIKREVGNSSTRYTEIKCQSNIKWDGFYIAVKASREGLTIAYRGHKVGDGGYHMSHSWGYYYPSSMDTTEFSSMMR